MKLMWSLNHFSASLTPTPKYNYVVKLDDDTYVHLPSLLSSLACSPRTSHYRGLLFTGRPYREATHKNFVSPRCMPLPVLPPYAYGGGYVLSADLVRECERGGARSERRGRHEERSEEALRIPRRLALLAANTAITIPSSF